MNFIRKGTALHTRSKWLVGKTRWGIGVVLALLGTLGTILGVPALGNQIRTDVPGLRCWLPVPMESSKFTVAMSPFVTINAQGGVRTTRDGRELARMLYTRLESSFDALDLDIPYELRSPDQSCPVLGATRSARAAAAETPPDIHRYLYSDSEEVIYGAPDWSY